MGAACSAGTVGAHDLHIDGASVETQVPASEKSSLTLVISPSDRQRLLTTTLPARPPPCIDLNVTILTADPPATLSMWVIAPDGREGRLLRPFRLGERSFRVQILSSHTRGFLAGNYLLTVEGGVRTSRIRAAVRYGVSAGASNSGWEVETAEQARDRLYAENRELQALVAKQKEYILVLKRKFLEKGQQLSHKEQELIIQKQKRAKFIINTWRMKTVVPAFTAWRQYATERKERKRELLGKVVLRMSNSQVWRAWRHWKGMIEGEKLRGLKAALASEKAKRARATILSWRLRTCAPVFQAWRKWAREYKERKRILMGKVVLRMQHKGLWQAFRQWKQTVEAQKVALMRRRMNEMAGRDRRTRIENFLNRWRHKTLIPKFQAWRRFAHEHRGKKRILLGKIVCRMSNARLWNAFRQWKRCIEDDKVSSLREQLVRHKRARAQQLIHMWRMRSLTPVFKAWRSFIHERHGKKRQLLAKVVLRMQHASLWAAFRQWSRWAEHERINQVRNSMAYSLRAQKKRRLAALMSRWQKSTIVSTFRRWRVWARQNHERKRQLLGKVVRRMASARQWQAWRQWKKYTDGLRMEEMKEQVRNELMATMMLNGGSGMGGSRRFGSSSSLTNVSGDYQALLLKYRSLKSKKLVLESSYDSLFRFLQRFRIQVARCIEEEIGRLTHHCRCDVCQTKRKMLNANGINEWLFQFDREIVRFKYPTIHQ